MSAPRYAALASKLLARAMDRPPAPLAAGERDDAVAAVERALGARKRARILFRWAWAAGVTVTLGSGAAWYATHRSSPPVATAEAPAPTAPPSVTVIGHPAGGGAIVEEVGAPAPLADGATLDLGSRITTRADGRVVLALSTGTSITMEEGSDLTLVDKGPSQVFSIRTGALEARVAKLEVGQRFLVRTPDSEIEVHGTAFRVAVSDADPACGEGTTTRVLAFEGVVSVRHGASETRLTAGQKWPADCAPARLPSPAPRPARAAATARTAIAEEPPPPAPKTTMSSDLTEQNDSFARAMAAKNRGAVREALADFDTFAARYPASQLLESTLVERMRLLRGLDRRRAREAARQYLARYPAGFARAEAQAMERETP